MGISNLFGQSWTIMESQSTFQSPTAAFYLRIQNIFGSDIHAIQLSASQRISKISTKILNETHLRPYYFNNTTHFWIFKAIARSLELGIGPSFQKISVEESHRERYGINAQLSYNLNTHHHLSARTSWIKSKQYITNNLRLFWTYGVSDKYRISAELNVDENNHPTLGFLMAYQTDKKWTISSGMQILPYQFSLHFSYRIRNSKIGVGSSYNLKLGGSPFIDVCYLGP